MSAADVYSGAGSQRITPELLLVSVSSRPARATLQAWSCRDPDRLLSSRQEGRLVTPEYPGRLNVQFDDSIALTIHRRSRVIPPEQSRPALEAVEKTYGFIPNLYRVLAGSPSAVQAYACVNEALKQSAFNPVEQQVAALTISAWSDCTYCVAAHSAIARMVEVPESTLQELRGSEPLPADRAEAIRCFATAILDRRGWVSREEREKFFQAGFTERHVLDLVTIVSLKTLSNYVNHIAETPLDERFAPLKWEDPLAGEH